MVDMIPALLETVEDEPVVAEENAVMDHQEEPIMAADDVLVAVGDSLMALENDTLKVVDNTLMAAVDIASVVVVVAIPMISLAPCQYFVAFLYFGTGFDTDHIYKCYNIQDYSINHEILHIYSYMHKGSSFKKYVKRDGSHWALYSLQNIQLVTVVWLRVMYHPSYSLDFTPSDFHLFGILKKHPPGKLFAYAFVCMQMYMYVCMYVHMYVCMYLQMITITEIVCEWKEAFRCFSRHNTKFVKKTCVQEI